MSRPAYCPPPSPHQNPFRVAPPDDVFLDDMYFPRPPPEGIEFERAPSPPPSTHSSLGGVPRTTAHITTSVLKPDEYQKARNRTVQDWLEDQERRRKKEAKREAKREAKKAIPEETCEIKKVKSQYSAMPAGEDFRIHYVLSDDDDWNNLVPNQKNPTVLLDDCLDQLLENEKGYRQGQPDTVVHRHDLLHRILRSKWLVVKLWRQERLMRGQATGADVPKEWLQFPEELQRLYGPLDETSERFKGMLLEFERQRYKAIIGMLEQECQLVDRLDELGLYSHDPVLVAMADKVADVKSKLKTSIEKLVAGENPVAHPATSVQLLGMDFYNLPRPWHSSDVYKIRSREYTGFIDFPKEPAEKEAPYNAALYDVGWNCYPNYVHLEKCIKAYFPPVKGAKTVLLSEYTNWLSRLLKLRAHLSEFPLGVELKTFAKGFRRKHGLEKKYIFGRLTDEQGAYQLTDLFFPQKLGKRIILFAAIFEGVIVTPKEILRRVWKQIRYLLEVKAEIKLIELHGAYETLFRRPLLSLSWGFQRIEDFVLYSITNLGEELRDLELFERKDVEGKYLRLKLAKDGGGQFGEEEGWKAILKKMNINDAQPGVSEDEFAMWESGWFSNSLADQTPA